MGHEILSCSSHIWRRWSCFHFLIIQTLIFIDLLKLYGPLNQLGYIYRSVNQSLVDTERLLALLNEPTEVNDKPDAPDLLVSDGKIEFGMCWYWLESTVVLMFSRKCQLLLWSPYYSSPWCIVQSSKGVFSRFSGRVWSGEVNDPSVVVSILWFGWGWRTHPHWRPGYQVWDSYLPIISFL